MELSISVSSILILATFVSSQQRGPCFTFSGNSFLHFTPNNFNNNDDIHYILQFRTTQSDGILMYARGGTREDDEALYIQDGKLKYALFNSAPTGIEGQFGGLFESEETVSTGEWITAHVYRSWRVADQSQRRIRYKTGLEVVINGQVSEYVDYLEREDISLSSTIFFGGFSEPLSESVSYYDGQIRDIREEKNGHSFENPSLNYQSKVRLSCGGGPVPN